MPDPSEKVSILIPCYNAERWIAQAIQSSLDQTYSNKEVIVVDDGSSDGSVEVIRKFGDAIRAEFGPNRGGNAARNRLLELSEGTWLQYLDADDFLKPDKVRDQMAVLAQHPEVDIIYGPTVMAYQEGDSVREELDPIQPPHDPWMLLAKWDLPQTGSPLWRKQAVIDVGRWKEEQPCCQEHELYSRLLMAGKKFLYDDASGSVYRQWSDETVCKKDVSKVHHYQTVIRKAITAYLREQGNLTAERLHAISQGHFEGARMKWLYDRESAEALMREVIQEDPTFMPSGDAAPKSYQWVYRMFGFAVAEKVAAFKRQSAG